MTARGVRGFEEREAQAIVAANALPEELLASRDLEALLDEIVLEHAAHLVIAHFDHKYVNTREIHGPNDKSVLKPLLVEIRVPAEGELATLLDVEPRVVTSLQYSGDKGDLIFAFELAPGVDVTSGSLGALFDEFGAQLTTAVAAANELLTKHQNSLRDSVRQLLEVRWRRTRRLRGALEELDIPLSANTASTMIVPVHPTVISMASADAAAAEGAPEWRLADAMSDGVIRIISDFGSALERLPNTADRLIGEDEETLRDVLLFLLNANFRGAATGETFVGYGKSDILLRWENRDAFLGECKVWKGKSALAAGVDQLLTRYSLWRQSRVALILFIRDPSSASAIIDKAHQTIRDHERTTAELPTSEPTGRRDYTVVTSGDARRPATLTLLPFVIPRSARAQRPA